MASTALLDAQALDHIRGRLQQLANSLSSLKRDIEMSDPLPAWPTIQSSAQLIFNQLDKLTPLLDEHRSFLTSAHAFPLPSFPRPAQEAVLGQLLRKKLEPGVEDWIDEGAAAWTRVEQDSNLASAEEDGLREFWEWAATQTIDLSTKVRWGLDYTEDELKRDGGAASVMTGLRRELNDGVETDGSSSGEDEDDDDDDDAGAVDTQEKDGDTSMAEADAMDKGKRPAAIPPTAIEDLFKFMNTGTSPRIT